MVSVTTSQKRDFIKWFLNNYQVKRRECAWLLNYICDNQALLRNIHFVLDSHNAPNGMTISTNCTDGVPFTFYNKGIMNTDAEKAFHYFRLNREESYYITLKFSDMKTCSEWFGVVEENPYTPTPSNKDRQFAENVLKQSIFEYELSRLDKEIDEALANGDKEKFMTLTEERATLLVTRPKKYYETIQR